MEKFNFGNKIIKGLKKATIPVAVTIATILPMKEVNAQISPTKDVDSTKNIHLEMSGNTGMIIPSDTWVFLEDSIWAQNESRMYPGLIENYLKDDKSGKYFFNGYEDKEGNPMDSPYEIQKLIDKEKQDSIKYSNPEKWAKEQFEYQKTKQFEDEKLREYITNLEEKIDALNVLIENYKVENAKDPNEYNEHYLELDKKDVERFQKSIEYSKKNPEWLFNRKNYEELVQEAKGYFELTNNYIKELQEKLENTLKYIESNRK